MSVPKFTQIAVGNWTGDSGKLTHSVYALGDNEKVYKYLTGPGFIELKGKDKESEPTMSAKKRTSRVHDEYGHSPEFQHN